MKIGHKKGDRADVVRVVDGNIGRTFVPKPGSGLLVTPSNLREPDPSAPKVQMIDTKSPEGQALLRGIEKTRNRG